MRVYTESDPAPTTRVESTLVGKSDDAWRHNFTYLKSGKFRDVINTPDSCWTLQPSIVKIFDPSQREQETEQAGLSGHRRTFLIDAGDLLRNGFSIGLLSELSRGEATLVDKAWSFDAWRSVGDVVTYKVRFRGEWNSTEASGRTTAREVLVNTYAAGDVGTITTFSEHRYHPDLGVSVPSRIVTRNAKGQPITSLEFGNAIPVVGGCEAAFQPPALPVARSTTPGDMPSPVDPLRGVLAITQVADYKSNELVSVQSGAKTPLDPPSPQALVTTNATAWRTYGYIALAGSIVVLFLLRRWSLNKGS